MPSFNRQLTIVPCLALLCCCGPQAWAQRGGFIHLFATPSEEVEVTSNMIGWFEPDRIPDLKKWHITKGKDFAKLPKEYQWDTAPSPVQIPYPVYPFELLQTEVSGKVRVFFVIGPDGRVIKVDLAEASRPEFGLAVRAMLDRCRFTPAKHKDGSPAYAYLGREYNFRAKGRSDAPVERPSRFILNDLETSSGNILRLQDLDHPLKPRFQALPVYPTALRQTMTAGEAEVEFYVDFNGYVQLPRIKASSAPEFGYAAVQAVAAWRFEPPTKGGKEVVVRAVVPIEFAGRPAADARK